MKFNTLYAGVVVGALLGASAALAALPTVEAPDSYAKPGQVRNSIEAMQETLADNAEGNWKAQRGAGVCEDAARRLRDYVTSQVYTAELGEKLWDECHKAYGDVE
jgi:gas vesicle protein